MLPLVAVALGYNQVDEYVSNLLNGLTWNEGGMLNVEYIQQ